MVSYICIYDIINRKTYLKTLYLIPNTFKEWAENFKSLPQYCPVMHILCHSAHHQHRPTRNSHLDQGRRTEQKSNNLFKLSNLVYRFFIRNKLNNQNRVWSKTFSTKMKSQKLKTIKIKVEMAWLNI